MLINCLWYSGLSLVGVVASLPGMPGQEWIIAKTKLHFATTTPVLAYAGLSLGKDLGAFRRLSWRIIPVALAVTAGTFICATALAQLVLPFRRFNLILNHTVRCLNYVKI